MAFLLENVELSLTHVEYPQTLLINSGGINWEWIHAVTVYPNGTAEIIWEDRFHAYDGRESRPSIVQMFERCDWFQVTDKFGWSGHSKERTHLCIRGWGNFLNITKDTVPGFPTKN